MKKPLLVMVTGLLLAIVAYGGLFIARTAGGHSEAPSELLWLRQEFGLSDQEFARIRDLHEGYLPECARMCAQIDDANKELESLVLDSDKVTPQITDKLAEISRIRQECQTQMLRHFYAVSQAMSPEQGRRYMAEMQKLTSLSNMRDHSDSAPSKHAH